MTRRTLAHRVRIDDTPLSRAIGFVGQSEPEETKAVVLRWPDDDTRHVHMLGVRFALDVLFVGGDGIVTETATLRPWIGSASGEAREVIELPAGAADGVRVGDRIGVPHESLAPTVRHYPNF